MSFLVMASSRKPFSFFTFIAESSGIRCYFTRNGFLVWKLRLRLRASLGSFTPLIDCTAMGNGCIETDFDLGALINYSE